MNLLVLPRDQVQFLFELLVATAVTRGLHILFFYSYVIANDAQRASSAFSCVLVQWPLITLRCNRV